jgi:hypothetical protein
MIIKAFKNKMLSFAEKNHILNCSKWSPQLILVFWFWLLSLWMEEGGKCNLYLFPKEKKLLFSTVALLWDKFFCISFTLSFFSPFRWKFCSLHALHDDTDDWISNHVSPFSTCSFFYYWINLFLFFSAFSSLLLFDIASISFAEKWERFKSHK